ncbi:MAG TPA: DNA-3-methyladenine glycosylase 2 family protein [Gemmatimonadetes bacterium]|nr:DNA-3-methyladenine glycosylase 2 family protein [Gemmatimonadota bacterium]
MSPARAGRSEQRTEGEEESWPEAHERLLGDPAFGPVVARVGPVRIQDTGYDSFSFLVRSVIYQQLAGKAAATIHGRLIAALRGVVSPTTVLGSSEDMLRGAGLSRAKQESIRDLAAKVADGTVPLDDLRSLTNEAVIERLIGVRGIGHWTAEMTLLFHLRRADVWPVGDLGVRAGIARIFDLKERPTPRETGLIGMGYRPWRSAAAWYCWRAMKPSPW